MWKASRATSALLRRRYFGFVFQGFNLLARTSAQENVELPLLYRGEARPRARPLPRARWMRWASKAGSTTPRPNSGGQQQRVAIARAIVTEPVLLADEPTGNLDTQRSHEIMELLWRLNAEQGITVLMVTHEPDMAAYARRMVRFVDGVVDSTPSTRTRSGCAPRRWWPDASQGVA
jgi:putative ABC transport system ATP-binding protein